MEWLTASDIVELTFYNDLLLSGRAVALFVKINDIPYVDMQATAIRPGMFAV